MTHQIAFLGTGIMGAPMAANLIKSGFQTAVWNRTSSKTDSLADLGARVADSPLDCVKGADYILSILDSGPVVREVFFDSGAADAMKHGAVFIDMASIPPKMAQQHAAWLKERGVGHLDAPVSGGSFGAAEGSLAIMAGGEQVDFDRTERRACGSRWAGRATSAPLAADRSPSSPTRSWSPATSPAWRKASYSRAPAAPTPPRFRWPWLAAMPTAVCSRSTAGA